MTIDECYAVLEIAAGASPADVRKAYKLLAAVWHPDRFTAGSKLHREAEEKLRKINEAYDTLKNHLDAGDGAASVGPGDSTSEASDDSEAYEKLATASLVCGIVALAYPSAVTGPIGSVAAIVTGILGLRSEKRGRAIAGMVLAGLALAVFGTLIYLEVSTRKELNKLLAPAADSKSAPIPKRIAPPPNSELVGENPPMADVQPEEAGWFDWLKEKLGGAETPEEKALREFREDTARMREQNRLKWASLFGKDPVRDASGNPLPVPSIPALGINEEYYIYDAPDWLIQGLPDDLRAAVEQARRQVTPEVRQVRRDRERQQTIESIRVLNEENPK